MKVGPYVILKYNSLQITSIQNVQHIIILWGAVSPPLLPGPTVAARADRRCPGPAAAARADRRPRGSAPTVVGWAVGWARSYNLGLGLGSYEMCFFCHQLDLNFIILFSTFYMDSTK